MYVAYSVAKPLLARRRRVAGQGLRTLVLCLLFGGLLAAAIFYARDHISASDGHGDLPVPAAWPAPAVARAGSP